MAAEFTRSDFIVEKKDKAYQGFFQINQYQVKHRLYAGDWSSVIKRELFERGNAAAVLMYDTNRDEVVLIEQFRIGALDEDSPWLLEVVAGMVEEGEQAAEVVMREAQEEAGCELSKVTHITDYLSSPGGTNEKISLYYAEVDSGDCAGIHGLESEGEDIKVCVMPFDQVWQAVISGQINNAATIIALQWLKIQKLTGSL